MVCATNFACLVGGQSRLYRYPLIRYKYGGLTETIYESCATKTHAILGALVKIYVDGIICPPFDRHILHWQRHFMRHIHGYAPAILYVFVVNNLSRFHAHCWNTGKMHWQ